MYNDSATPQSGLTVRVFVDLSEVFAAGLSNTDVVTAKYWDQCGAVVIGPAQNWRTGTTIYAIDLTWQGRTFAPGSSCEVQFSIHPSGWQSVWNSANDYSYQGLTATPISGPTGCRSTRTAAASPGANRSSPHPGSAASGYPGSPGPSPVATGEGCRPQAAG